MVFLTGRSGAGKSTVLKLIALLERPTRGQVLVNGQNTAKLPLRRVPLFRRGLGVVFQDHRLLMDRPVFDNVALPLIVADTSFKRNRQARTRRARSGGTARQGARAPLELSVGEQQRVGIARAVVSKPPLLVADEPTGNLDADAAAEVMGLFRRFNEVGVTVVVATHDLHLVRESGLREIVLEDGRQRRSAGRRCRHCDSAGAHVPGSISNWIARHGHALLSTARPSRRATAWPPCSP